MRFLAIALLLVSSAVFGGDKAVLDAKPEYGRDSKIILRVKGADNEIAYIKWWVRSDEGKQSPEYEVFDQGRAVAVWASPGKYEALVVVALPDDKLVTFIDAGHKFVVTGVSPTPTPDPTPTPTPTEFGDVKKIVSDIIAPVRDDNKKEGCKAIADAYRKHGELSKRGEYPDQNLLADATSSEFVYELGLNRYIRYRPAMSKLREHMQGLINSGVLKDKDMKKWADLWIAYADAFEVLSK